MHRVTISLEAELANAFDRCAKDRGYQNRSEAVRDLVRQAVSEQRANSNPASPCIANLSYIFNHQERSLAQRLMAVQHRHRDIVVSTSHVLLDQNSCIETLILRGATGAVQSLADELCVERGVSFGSLNLISVDASGEDVSQHGALDARQRSLQIAVPLG